MNTQPLPLSRFKVRAATTTIRRACLGATCLASVSAVGSDGAKYFHDANGRYYQQQGSSSVPGQSAAR
jgi:hypothetical protein